MSPISGPRAALESVGAVIRSAMRVWLFRALVELQAISMFATQSKAFDHIGQLFNSVCNSRSPADSHFRWMLLHRDGALPSIFVRTLQLSECVFESRSLDSLPNWNITSILTSVEYKVIAVNLTTNDLREALSFYVSTAIEGLWESPATNHSDVTDKGPLERMGP